MTFQLAIGEKISNIIMIISTFIAGMAVSFSQGWILSAVLLTYAPFIIVTYTKNISTKASVSEEEEHIYRESDRRAQ